ncbi:MAG: AAA family ATPase [Coprococcus sp.]
MDSYIITIARETGSGGLEIAKKLSKTLGIPYYDRELLRRASDVSGIHESLFGLADERIGWKEMLFSAKKVYNGEVLPPDDDDFVSTRNLFNFQAEVIKDIAKTESCIIVGRCANYLLKDYPRVLRLFICAPLENRYERIREIHVSKSEKDVIRYIEKEDKRRSDYYHYYTNEEWRDVSAYDVCMDTSKYGISGCVDKVQKMIDILL